MIIRNRQLIAVLIILAGIVFVGTASAATAPSIVSWWNSVTNDNTLNIDVYQGSTIKLSVTSDQEIKTIYYWQQNMNWQFSEGSSSTTRSIYLNPDMWTPNGGLNIYGKPKLNNIRVWGTNANGTTNVVQWNLNVLLPYNFLGFIPPIKSDGSSKFNSGSTVPVKFRLADANGANVTTASAYLTYQLVVDGTPGNEVSPALNTFTYLTEDNLYLLELDTTGMVAGAYRINVYPDDGTVYNVEFSLKS